MEQPGVIGARVIRPVDQPALKAAAAEGDAKAHGCLQIVKLTLDEARTTGAIPCCRCDRLLDVHALRQAAICIAWVEGRAQLQRSVACRLCAEAVDDEALRQRAADQLNHEMNHAYAMSRGCVFHPVAGNA